MLSRSHSVWGAWIEIRIACAIVRDGNTSHSVWGAWIEIRLLTQIPVGMIRRTPYGVRGLKFHVVGANKLPDLSRTPYGVRGLKCFQRQFHALRLLSHSVWGAWIEMILPRSLLHWLHRRTPYGVRGLKFDLPNNFIRTIESHSVWGAWIEICRIHGTVHSDWRRTPYGVRGLKSLPSNVYCFHFDVALRMGCVD